MSEAGQTATVSWVLDDLVKRVDGVKQAVVLSRDGLMLGSSRGLSREDAEHLAAVAAGLQSLARGAALRFDGGQPRQSIVHMDRAMLFVMAAAEGSCLAVLSPADAEHGLIAYEMAMLVKRLGQYLSANPRAAATALTAERLSE
ncbi:MAG TPA: roadblock/LC7 domain-containing protein [Streptosporangiaceae bacterium]|nr:roadblock/LC7 domain-containing protein [Streptosporangiaceae bacterium]